MIEVGHRLILGRAPSAGLIAEVASGRLGVERALTGLVASREFEHRIRRQAEVAVIANRPQISTDLVDVAALREAKSIDEHNAAAEEYFASLGGAAAESLLAKPFADLAETTELLTCFAHLLAGLRPMRGMTVLDFGAGSCWTSWYFAQLGCKVIATDVSKSALDLGRERFRRWQTAGDQPTPEFLLFDGRRIDLPDASVDRVCCFDAFHHLSNQAEVLAEFARVLKPGGLAAFDEPGRNHSRTTQAQYEMRAYGVIEGDIDLHEMSAMATAAELEFHAANVFAVQPFWAGLAEFTDTVEHALPSPAAQQHLARQLVNKQLFLLRKPGEEVPDSRDRAAIGGQISLDELTAVPGPDGLSVTIAVTAVNTGRAAWLPLSAGVGAVQIGLRLVGSTSWEGRLRFDTDEPIAPGDKSKVRGTVLLPAAAAGQELHIDLVSESVAWFENLGIPPIRTRL